MKFVIGFVLIVVLTLTGRVESAHCKYFPLVDNLHTLFAKIIFRLIPVKELTKYQVKNSRDWVTIKNEAYVHKIFKKLKFDCVENKDLEGQKQVVVMVPLKYQETEAFFRTTITYPKGPNSVLNFSFEFTRADSLDLAEIFKQDLLNFTDNENSIVKLVNGYFFSAIMSESIKSLDIDQIPTLFADLQSNGVLIDEGFHVVSLRRQPYPKIQGMGMITSMMEGLDVIFFGWKIPKIAQNHTASIELMFRLAPQQELPLDFVDSSLGSVIDDAVPRRGFYLGFEGIQLSAQSFESDTNKYNMVDGLYAFDMMNCLPNFIKAQSIADEFPLISKKGHPTQRVFLVHAESLDYSVLINDNSKRNFSLGTVEGEVDLTVAQKDQLLTKNLVRKMAQSLIRYLHAEVFDNMQLIKAEHAVIVNGESNIDLVSSDKPKQNESQLLQKERVYEFRVSVNFDKSQFKIDLVEPEVLDDIVKLNAFILKVKKVPFKQDYLEIYGSGHVVQMELYFDEQIYQQKAQNPDQFFTGVAPQLGVSEKREQESEHVSQVSSELSSTRSSDSGSKKSAKAIILDQKTNREDKSNKSKQEDQLGVDEDEDLGDKASRKKINDEFPFKVIFKDAMTASESGESPVHPHSLLLSRYLVKEYLLWSVHALDISEDDVEDGRFFEYPVREPASGKIVNEPVKRELEPLLEDLELATVDTRVVKNVTINSVLYNEVDQVTFVVKENRGLFFLIFRFARRDAIHWKPNTFRLEFMVHLSDKASGFETPNLDSDEFSNLYASSTDTFKGALWEKEFVWGFTQIVDALVFKKKESVVEIMFDDIDPDTQDFVHKQKNADGTKAFVFDSRRREISYDLVTFPFKETRGEPNKKGTQKSPKRGVFEPRDDQDFSGGNHFKVKAAFVTANFATDTATRRKQMEEYEKLALEFTLEFGDCPKTFVTNFQFIPSLKCTKIFSEGKYMLEFKDSAQKDISNEVQIERVLRLYTFWPEIDELDDEQKMELRVNHHQGGFLGFSAYERHLTYRLLVVNSVHLESFVSDEDNGETSDAELEVIAQREVERLDSAGKDQGESPKVTKGDVDNTLRAISLNENEFLPLEKNFLKYLLAPDRKNKSQFGTIAGGLAVMKHVDDSDYEEVPADVETGRYNLKVELTPKGFSQEKVIKYFQSKDNEVFFKKMQHLENEEKYVVEVEDYYHFNAANARVNSGQEIVVKLVEGDDSIWADHRALRGLILL